MAANVVLNRAANVNATKTEDEVGLKEESGQMEFPENFNMELY